MSRSRPASDLTSSIRFIPISTLWHISEVFTKLFSDIIASSQSGFPSLYINRIIDDVVVIFAVLDCRRNPSWIRERLMKG